MKILQRLDPEGALAGKQLLMMALVGTLVHCRTLAHSAMKEHKYTIYGTVN